MRFVALAKKRVSYSGYYVTLPRSRGGFDSRYPLSNKKNTRFGGYSFYVRGEQANLLCLRGGEAGQEPLSESSSLVAGADSRYPPYLMFFVYILSSIQKHPVGGVFVCWLLSNSVLQRFSCLELRNVHGGNLQLSTSLGVYTLAGCPL